MFDEEMSTYNSCECMNVYCQYMDVYFSVVWDNFIDKEKYIG